MYFEDIFLINFTLNLINLIICKKILKSPKKIRWQICAGIIGSIYAICFYYFDINYFLGKIAVSLLIVLVAFGHRQFVKKYLTFHIITYAFGGAVYGLVSLLGITGTAFPIKTFIFAIAFAFVSITIASTVMDKHKILVKNIFELRINDMPIPCLHDTGNESGLIIAEIGALRKILPSEFCLDFIQNENIIDILEKWKDKLGLKIIPYKGLSGSGFLIAFVPQSIQGSDKKLVAIHKGKLTNTELYNAIA